MRQESRPSAYRADSAPSPYRTESGAAPAPPQGAGYPPPQVPPGYPPGYGVPGQGPPPGPQGYAPPQSPYGQPSQPVMPPGYPPQAPPGYPPQAPPGYPPPGFQQPSQPVYPPHGQPGYPPPGYAPPPGQPAGPPPTGQPVYQPIPNYAPPGYPPQEQAPGGSFGADSQSSPYRMESQPAYGVEQPGMGDQDLASSLRQPSDPLLPDNYQVDAFDLRVDPQDDVAADEGPQAWQSPADVGAGDAAPAPGPERAGRPSPSRRVSGRDSGGDGPDTLVMMVRTLLAVGALGGAVIAFVNAGAVGSIAYAFGGLFACFAVWGIATFRSSAGWGQTGLELGVVAAIAVAAFVVKPEIFSPDKGAPAPAVVNGGGETPHGGEVGEATLPDTPLGDFTGLALEYLAGVELLLAIEGAAPYAAWDNVTAKLDSWDEMPSKHSELGTDDQAAAFDTWDAVRALQKETEAALRKYKRPAKDGFKFAATPEIASDLAAKHRVASDAAQSLKQTVEVYTGGSGGAGGE